MLFDLGGYKGCFSPKCATALNAFGLSAHFLLPTEHRLPKASKNSCAHAHSSSIPPSLPPSSFRFLLCSCLFCQASDHVTHFVSLLIKIKQSTLMCPMCGGWFVFTTVSGREIKAQQSFVIQTHVADSARSQYIYVGDRWDSAPDRLKSQYVNTRDALTSCRCM